MELKSKQNLPPLIAPPPARVYSIVAFNNIEDFFYARKKLAMLFGTIDYETNDYSTQGWSSIYGVSYSWLRFISFERLIKREELVNIRQQTLQLERQKQSHWKILFDIDPGYITQYNVVRTVLQDSFHRVYLYGGIFAESFYHFSEFSYKAFEHSSEFFCRDDIIQAFNDLRIIHLED